MVSKDLPPLEDSWTRIYLRSQIRYNKIPAPPEGTNLQGKVVVITGGNAGIGFECARQFLSLGVARLIITARDKERGEEAASKLRGEHPTATVDVWLLDMFSYESMQQFVTQVGTRLSRLDIVILNAGRSKLQFEIVPSTGHEENLQVNYLSTVFLILLLLPVMKLLSPPGEPGRLSVVTSGTILSTNFPNMSQRPLLQSFDDLKTAPPPGLASYATSKLLGHMFVCKLVDHISSERIIVNMVDPGGTKGTGLGRDLPAAIRMVALPLVNVISRTVADAAHTYLDAVLVKGKESHGCFVMDGEIRPYHPVLYTPEGKEAMERPWEETLDEFQFIEARGIIASLDA